ncbi:hypothetical protein ACH439_12605 [Streptomyces microflavus]|uniref:hypothetical protein n=1 Tax=Streptomyces microflavus TaxID=1919 RepID=UPI0037B62BF9
MAEQELEAPGSPSDLYRSLGADVEPCRPYLTGDVFSGVETVGPDGVGKKRDVAIIQHPCALRTNGVDLAPQLLVVKVQQHPPVDDWTKYTKLMPLPDLHPEATSPRKRHWAAMFDSLYLVTPHQLGDNRIACLSEAGINLLLQRWVHHSSRATVATHTFEGANSHVFEEADLIEDWSVERVGHGLKREDAAAECVAWLREDQGEGETRQRQLRVRQQRSAIRSAMRKRLRSLIPSD